MSKKRIKRGGRSQLPRSASPKRSDMGWYCSRGIMDLLDAGMPRQVIDLAVQKHRRQSSGRNVATIFAITHPELGQLPFSVITEADGKTFVKLAEESYGPPSSRKPPSSRRRN